MPAAAASLPRRCCGRGAKHIAGPRLTAATGVAGAFVPPSHVVRRLQGTLRDASMGRVRVHKLSCALRGPWWTGPAARVSQGHPRDAGTRCPSFPAGRTTNPFPQRGHPLPVRPVMAATSSRHRPPQLTHSPRHQTGLPHGAGTAPGSAQDQGVTGQFLRRSHARSRFPLNLPSATRSCPRRIPAFWKGGPRVARRGADVSGGSKRVLAARDPALLTAVGGSLGLVCLGCVGGTLPRVFGY